MAKRRSGKRSAGGPGTGNRPVSRRQVQAGTVTRVGGKKTRAVVAGARGARGTGKGAFDRTVKVKNNLDRMKGKTFLNKAGKRVAAAKAVTKKGNLRSGFSLGFANKGRTGTRRSAIVGGGQSG